MLNNDAARCTGVLTTHPAAELCKRCERAQPSNAVLAWWIEPMARKHSITGALVCECFKRLED